MANNNTEQLQKLFVGGLNRDANEGFLSECFQVYGNIVDVSVLRDSIGRSRGFGFVVFDNSASVDEIMKLKKEGKAFQVNGGVVEVKRALPRVDRSELLKDRAAHLRQTNIGVRKVFVGGLASTTDTEKLEAYFSKFGKVLEASVLIDKITTRSRGFGFVVFDDEDIADKVCALRDHTIDGKLCEVRKAEPRSALMHRRDREQFMPAFRADLPRLQGMQNQQLDIGNIGSALQVLNSLQSLVNAAQYQQVLTHQGTTASQYQGSSYGMAQYPLQAATTIPVQNSLPQNTNQNANILQFLQSALSNQTPVQAVAPSPVMNLPTSNSIGSMLNNAAPANANLAPQNTDALGLLYSLAGINQQSITTNKPEVKPNVAHPVQSVQNSTMVTPQGASSTLNNGAVGYYDDVYGAQSQAASNFGPVRYPPRSDSKSTSYRPY